MKEKEKINIPCIHTGFRSRALLCTIHTAPLSANLIYNNFHNSTGLASIFLHARLSHAPRATLPTESVMTLSERAIERERSNSAAPYPSVRITALNTKYSPPTTGDVEKSADGLAESTRPAEMEIESEWRIALGTFAARS